MARQLEADRSTVYGPRRDLQVLGLDAGRQSQNLYLRHGGEIGHYLPVGWRCAAGARSVRTDRSGVVWTWNDQAGRDHNRRWSDVACRHAARAAAAAGADEIPNAVALRWAGRH